MNNPLYFVCREPKPDEQLDIRELSRIDGDYYEFTNGSCVHKNFCLTLDEALEIIAALKTELNDSLSCVEKNEQEIVNLLYD